MLWNPQIIMNTGHQGTERKITTFTPVRLRQAGAKIADLCSIQSETLEYEQPIFDMAGLNIAGLGREVVGYALSRRIRLVG